MRFGGKLTLYERIGDQLDEEDRAKIKRQLAEHPEARDYIEEVGTEIVILQSHLRKAGVLPEPRCGAYA